MTPRQRWLAAVALAPVDRLPFWPKINGAYAQAQRPPFTTMDSAALHAWIGSDPHVGVGGTVRVTSLGARAEHQREGDVMRTLYRVGATTLTMVQRHDAASASWHPIEFPIKQPGDLAVMTQYFADQQVELDAEGKAKAQARQTAIGETAISADNIGVSPLMDFVEHLAGIEQAHYFLTDHVAAVETLFAAMHAHLRARAAVICEHSPADLIYMVENTSTTLISPAQYRRYCLPHLRDYCACAQAHGRNMVFHMCGHLKLLLPDLATLPVRAFEAFTSPTVGNTTLADGRAGCPHVCLIGGTNAFLWTRPLPQIIATLERDLAALPHTRGIVVTSAGVMPPAATPEKIKSVCDWVKAYPARN